MSEQSPEQSILFGKSFRDEVSFNADVETKIDDVIWKKLRSISAWVITVLLSVVFGGIITSLWDLNGKIHNVIGQESVRSMISEIQETKIKLLNSEKIFLGNRVDVLKLEINKLKGALK